MGMYEGEERVLKDNEDNLSSLENILKEIEQVKQEWGMALQRLNDVYEKDAVDFSIYYILAAERRYMYLLNKYKSMQSKDKKKRIKEALVEVIKQEEE